MLRAWACAAVPGTWHQAALLNLSTTWWHNSPDIPRAFHCTLPYYIIHSNSTSCIALAF